MNNIGMKGLPSIAVTIIFLMFFLNACQRATKNSDVVVSNQKSMVFIALQKPIHLMDS